MSPGTKVIDTGPDDLPPAENGLQPLRALEHPNADIARTFVVNWSITNQCNYHCSYCPDVHHKGTCGLPPAADVLGFVKLLREQLPNRRLFVELTGGEVTLFDDVLPLVTGIRSLGGEIGINSNGSRSASWWRKLAPNIDHTVLTFHIERAQPDKFLELLACVQTLTHLTATILMHPERFDECLEVARLASKLDWCTVILKPVFINLGPVMYAYSPEQRKVLMNPDRFGVERPKVASPWRPLREPMLAMGTGWPNAQVSTGQILVAGWNHFRAWQCYAGVEQLVVDPAGFVARAWCDPVALRIGHFQQRDFRVPRSPVICEQSSCPCFFDVTCTKRLVSSNSSDMGETPKNSMADNSTATKAHGNEELLAQAATQLAAFRRLLGAPDPETERQRLLLTFTVGQSPEEMLRNARAIVAKDPSNPAARHVLARLGAGECRAKVIVAVGDHVDPCFAALRSLGLRPHRLTEDIVDALVAQGQSAPAAALAEYLRVSCPYAIMIHDSDPLADMLSSVAKDNNFSVFVWPQDATRPGSTAATSRFDQRFAGVPATAIAPLGAQLNRLAPGRGGSMPLMSVVVPTRDRPQKVRNLLDYLSLQTLDTALFEVIVVDDGSRAPLETDLGPLNTPFPLKIVRQEALGIGAARRRSVEEAQGRFLFICNDDTLPASDNLARHLHCQLRAPTPRAVLGNFDMAPALREHMLLDMLQEVECITSYTVMHPGQVYDWRYFWTLNISVRRDLVLACGNFDPGFANSTCEDVDLGRRLQYQQGVFVQYEPSIKAEHDHAYDFAAMEARSRAWGRGMRELWSKWHDPLAFMLTPEPQADSHLRLGWRQLVEKFERERPRLRQKALKALQAPAQGNPGTMERRQQLHAVFQEFTPFWRGETLSGLFRAPNPTPPTTNQAVCVVVLGTGTLADLRRTLAGVKPLSRAGAKVLVIDAGLSARARRFVDAQADLQVVPRVPALDPIAAMNSAFGKSDGCDVLVVCCGAQLGAGCASRMLVHLHQWPDIGMVGPCYDKPCGPQVAQGLYATSDLRFEARAFADRNRDRHDYVESLAPYVLAIRAELIGKVGELNEKISHLGLSIAELCQRARAAGYLLRVASDCLAFVDSELYRQWEHATPSQQRSAKVVGLSPTRREHPEPGVKAAWRLACQSMRPEARIPDHWARVAEAFQAAGEPGQAAYYARQLLQLSPAHSRAAAVLAATGLDGRARIRTAVVGDALSLQSAAMSSGMATLRRAGSQLVVVDDELVQALGAGCSPRQGMLTILEQLQPSLVIVGQGLCADELRAAASGPTVVDLGAVRQRRDAQDLVESGLRRCKPAAAVTGRAETPPKLSVIVPAFARQDHIRNLLDCLLLQDLAPWLFEVIVVDDGSPVPVADALDGLITPFSLQILRQPNSGPAAARNFGLSRAQGEWVVFFNDDAQPAPDNLRRHLVAQAGQTEPTAVLGAFDFRPELQTDTLTAALQERPITFLYPLMKEHGRYGWTFFWTPNISLRRAHLDAVGGFDREVIEPVSEDVEIGYRLQTQLGLEVQYEPAIRSWHNHLFRYSDLVPRRRIWGRMEVRMWRKHVDCRILAWLTHFRWPDEQCWRRLLAKNKHFASSYREHVTSLEKLLMRRLPARTHVAARKARLDEIAARLRVLMEYEESQGAVAEYFSARARLDPLPTDAVMTVLVDAWAATPTDVDKTVDAWRTAVESARAEIVVIGETDAHEHDPDHLRVFVPVASTADRVAAWNRAMRLATGDVVAFTTGSQRTSRFWSRTKAHFDAAPDIGIVFGTRGQPVGTGGDLLPADFMLVRREVVLRVGDFNAKLSGRRAIEEWCTRARQLGFAMTVASDLAVNQHAPMARRDANVLSASSTSADPPPVTFPPATGAGVAVSPTPPKGLRLTSRSVLYVGFACNIHCRFCYYEQKGAWRPLALCQQRASLACDVFGDSHVDITGGEPTVHPDILALVAHCRQIGLLPTIITNARVLSDPSRLQAFRDHGIEDFLCSVHAIGSTYDDLVGVADGWEKLSRALENFADSGTPWRANCTVTAANYRDLQRIARHVREYGGRAINFISFNPFDRWQTKGEIDFQVRHSEAGPYLREALTYCDEVGLQARARYFPYCAVRGHEAKVTNQGQLSYDPYEWNFCSWYCDEMDAPAEHMTRQAILEQRQTNEDAFRLRVALRQRRALYARSPACVQCALAAICDGLTRQYFDRFGGQELCAYDGPTVRDVNHFSLAAQRPAF